MSIVFCTTTKTIFCYTYIGFWCIIVFYRLYFFMYRTHTHSAWRFSASSLSGVIQPFVFEYVWRSLHVFLFPFLWMSCKASSNFCRRLEQYKRTYTTVYCTPFIYTCMLHTIYLQVYLAHYLSKTVYCIPYVFLQLYIAYHLSRAATMAITTWSTWPNG